MNEQQIKAAMDEYFRRLAERDARVLAQTDERAIALDAKHAEERARLEEQQARLAAALGQRSELPPVEYVEKVAALAKAHDVAIVVSPHGVNVSPSPLAGGALIPSRLGGHRGVGPID